MKLKLAMAALVAMFNFNAIAGFMVEPYVGTGRYATTFDASALSDEEEPGASVTTAGARLGYSLLLFSGGVDYQLDSLAGGSRTNLAAFVGVDLPVLLRFYGKYIVSSNLDLDDADYDTSLNSGYAVGVGFTGLPFVVINLEVEASNYTLEDIPSFGDVDIDYAQTMLSVSLPLP